MSKTKRQSKRQIAAVWSLTAALCGTVAQAQSNLQETPFTQRAVQQGHIDYITVGGSFRTANGDNDSLNVSNLCAIKTSATTSSVATNSGFTNGMNAIAPAAARQSFQRVPADATIKAAYLYWGGSAGYTSTAQADTNVDLTIAGKNFNIDATAEPSYSYFYYNRNGLRFMNAFADLSNNAGVMDALRADKLNPQDIVLENLRIANATNQLMCTAGFVWGSWGLYVVYEDKNLPTGRFYLYDGLLQPGTTTAVREVTASGFQTADASQDEVSRFTIMAGDGDPDSKVGEKLTLRTNKDAEFTVADSLNPRDNFFNGTISYGEQGGQATLQSNTTNNVSSTVGGGIDLDTVNVGEQISPGVTSMTFGLSSSGSSEVYFPQNVAFLAGYSEADLRVRKTNLDADGVVEVGDTFTYRVKIDNTQSPVDEAYDVVLTDTLPSGLEYVSSTVSYDGGSTKTAVSPTVSGNTLTFPAIRRLDKDGTVYGGTEKTPSVLGRQNLTYLITVRANGGAAGTLTNTATVSSGSFETTANINKDNTATAPVTVKGARITLRKEFPQGAGGPKGIGGDYDTATISIVQGSDTLASDTTNNARSPSPIAISVTDIVPGPTYTLAETLDNGAWAYGSDTYATRYTCTNASTQSTTVLPTNESGQRFTLTPQAGDDITCTFRNYKEPPKPPLQCQTTLYTTYDQAGGRNFDRIIATSTTSTIQGSAVANVRSTATLGVSPDGRYIYSVPYASSDPRGTGSTRTLYYEDVTANTLKSVAFTNGTGENVLKLAAGPSGEGYFISFDYLWSFTTAADGTPTVSGPVKLTYNNESNLTPAPKLNGNGDLFVSENGDLFLLRSPSNDSGEPTANFVDLFKVKPSGEAFFYGRIKIAAEGDNITVNAIAALNDKIYASTLDRRMFEIDLVTLEARETTSNKTFGTSSDLASCDYPRLEPDINASKTVEKVAGSAGTVVLPGDTLEYTISVRNTGSLNATSVRFQDDVPAGSTYIADSTTLNGNAVADQNSTFPYVQRRLIQSPNESSGVVDVDTTPDVPNDNEAVIKFRVRVNKGVSKVTNQGTVTYVDSPGDVPTDDPTTDTPDDKTVVTVGQPAKLTLRKVFPDGVYGGRDPNQATIRIRGADGTILTTATTGNYTKPGIASTETITVASGQTYTFGEVPGDSNTDLRDYASSYDCTNAVTSDTPLPSGKGQKFTLVPADGDNITCTFTNAKSQAAFNITKEPTTNFKIVSYNQGDVIKQPDVSYDIVVRNTGNTDATNVVLREKLAADLNINTFRLYDTSDGGKQQVGQRDVEDNSISVTIPTLAAGEQRTFQMVGKAANPSNLEGYLNDGDPATNFGGLANAVYVTADNADNAQDDAVIDVIYTTLTKEVRNVTANGEFGVSASGKPGEVLEYCLNFSNYGNANLDNYKVEDSVPQQVTYKAQTLRTTGVVTDPEAGVVVNDSFKPGSAGRFGKGLVSTLVSPLKGGAQGKTCFQVTID